jgi:hypothetical protein
MCVAVIFERAWVWRIPFSVATKHKRECACLVVDDATVQTLLVNDTFSKQESTIDPPSTRLKTSRTVLISPNIIVLDHLLGQEALEKKLLMSEDSA